MTTSKTQRTMNILQEQEKIHLQGVGTLPVRHRVAHARIVWRWYGHPAILSVHGGNHARTQQGDKGVDGGNPLWAEKDGRICQHALHHLVFPVRGGKHAENGFAIRTLALPVIQCFGIVNNRNEFHARYNTLLNELTNEVNGFGKYIETSEVLVAIKNECNIWERALSLPFIYS